MDTPTQNPTPPPTSQPMSPPSGNGKKNLIIALAFILVIVLAAVGYVLMQNKKLMTGTQNNPGGSNTGTSGEMKASPSPVKPINAVAPPTVTFNKWTIAKKPATSPTEADIYSFRTAYTMDDLQNLAKKLDAAGSVKKDKDFVIAYTIRNNNKEVTLLTYNLKTGTMSYASSQGMALGAGATIEAKVYDFLKELNLFDDTLKATARYKRKSKPGLTYVEIHRDWQKVGMPILNSIGLLNLPENQSLSTLSLTTKITNQPADADIQNTTDGKDGLMRQTDYNTITVVVSDKDSKVTGIQSNVRQLAATPTRKTGLVTYDQAVEHLQSGMYDFLLTTPSGTGDMPWDKVYPNNKAIADNAIVTDSLLAYVEKPVLTDQKEMMPSYIFRGYAQLVSGYRVNFVATVPAVSTSMKMETTSKPQSKRGFSLIKEVYAQDNSDTTQKQGTFEVTPGAGGTSATSGNNPASSVDNPILQTTRDANGVCRPAVENLSPILLIGGLKYGWANWRVWQGKESTSKDGFWYYIPEPGTTTTDIQQNLDQIIALLQSPNPMASTPVPTATTAPNTDPSAESPNDDTTQKQGTFIITPEQATITQQNVTQDELTIRQQTKILRDLGVIADSCPVRLTGASPTLFVYGAEGTELTVQSKATLTYLDPVTDLSGAWNVVTHGSQLNVNGYERPYIYYEYKPVTFDRPDSGWNVNRSELDAVVKTVSSSLGLTKEEESRLAFELNHAATSLKGDQLFVGLIPQTVVDAKIPLQMSRKPANTYRYHFYVGAASASEALAPHLSTISRNGLTVVELGSYAAK